MFKQFLFLEWKSFFRSPNLAINIILKILVYFYLFLFALLALIYGAGTYFFIEEMDMVPFEVVNKYIIYYFTVDLFVRYIFQRFNPLNIKPLLATNVSKKKIVNFILAKSTISIFNIINYLYLIPLTVVFLINDGFSLKLLVWGISLLALVNVNNLLNLLLNKKNAVFFSVFGILAVCGALHYWQIIDITVYTQYFYTAFYEYPFLILVLAAALFFMYRYSFSFYKNSLYLDKGLQKKKDEVQNVNLTWLDRFGVTGTFLKLDIKMLMRNKRSKTAMISSFVFIFYGLLIFTNIVDMYSSPVFYIFGAIFVTGGFVFNFGNYIPSWDSSYYPFMMTQNITYKNYLKSKWWLMVIATILCTFLATFYLYFGWPVYLMVFSAALFNIGVNSYLVMLSGAFVKTPIDLSTNKNLMGDKTAFNMNSILLAMPKIFLPVILFFIGKIIYNDVLGCVLVGLIGIIGLAFRDLIFKQIERIYKAEKYKTIQAYKQKN